MFANYDFNGTSTKPVAANPFNGTSTAATPTYTATVDNKKVQVPSGQLPPKPFAATKLGVLVNTVKGLPKAALDTTVDLAQSIARSFSATGQSILNATVAKIPAIGYQPVIPAPAKDDNSAAAKLHRFMYGNEDVKDLATHVVENETAIKNSPTAKKYGLDKYALPMAFGGVIGSATLDLVPGGAAEKNVIKALAQETTEEGAFKILKNVGLSDDVAKKFAADMADTQDVNAIKDMLTTAKSVHGSQVLADHLVDEAPGTIKQADVPENLRPLAEEAKKFATPEEFKASLDTPKLQSLVDNTKGASDEAVSITNDLLKEVKDSVDHPLSQKISKFFDDAKISTKEDVMALHTSRLETEAALAERAKVTARETENNLKRFGENTEELRKNIGDLETHIDTMKSYIESSPTKAFWDKVRPLVRVVRNADKPYLSTGLDEINASALRNPKASELARRLDSVIAEYGYKDLPDAQAKLETWLNSRKQLDELRQARAAMVRDLHTARQTATDKISLEKFLNQGAEKTRKLIEARDNVKAGIKLQERKAAEKVEAEALRTKGLDPDITKANGGVVPPTARGGIRPPEVQFNKWKDRGALSLNRETLERNLEKIAGPDAKRVKEFIVNPVRENETARVKFNNTLRNKIKTDIVDRYGIRAGSKADAMIQKVGEKLLTPDEMFEASKKYGEKKWNQIKQASVYFKDEYAKLLDQVNTARAKYGYAPIPKRDDYFRHFQEIDNAIKNFGLILREQDLPTEIAGITGIFNPGKPFSTAEMKRKGLTTTYSAIKGFDNYLDSISKQIYHIDSVQRGRALEKYIRQSAKAVADVGLPEDQIKLPNFVSNLHDYTNIMAGKKSALDRAFESMVGRPIYGIMNWIGRKTGANAIGANISSALTNFAPFVQSLATTRKMPAIRGLGSGMMAPFLKDGLAKFDGQESSFMVRRFPEQQIDLTGFTKNAQKYAGKLFEAIDQFTTRSIVGGKYYDLVARGVSPESAMKAADEYAGRIIGDRSVGNMPNLFNSQTLKAVTQFQLEVNNMYSFLKHDLSHMNEGSVRKVASALAQFTLYSYIFNSGYQQIVGRRPLLDPIYTTLTLLGLTDEGEGVPVGKRVANAVYDVGGNMPFVGGITGGRFPISSGIPNVAAILKGDSTVGKELMKPVTYLAPPFGGAQVSKSINGLNAYLKKKVTSASGKTTKYKIKQTPSNLVKAVLFGPSSVPEASKYYNSLDKKKKSTGKYSF